MSLRPDELRWLEEETERCDGCFHLKTLHNSDNEYGTSCNVAGCRCEDGRVRRLGPEGPPMHGPSRTPSMIDVLSEQISSAWYAGYDNLADSATKLVGLSAWVGGKQ